MKIKIKPYEKLEKTPPPEDADSPNFPDKTYEQHYQYAVKLLKAFYDKQIEKALKDVFSVYKNFITIDDLSRYIIYKIEEYTTLPEDIKQKLIKRFESLYNETKTKTIGIKTGFSQPDIETIMFIDKLNDVYLGKFFSVDQKVKVEVLNWIKKYYFEEGNPIGKGQKGIKEFLNKFGAYLKDKSDHKIRQIIDTTVNFVKTAAQINAYTQANIKKFVWDAVNDRLTCPACRNMDGRIIKTKQALNQLQEIINKGLNARPIITAPLKEKTENIPVKFPPLHPNCYSSDTEIYTNEGWKPFSELTGNELIFTFNPENEKEISYLPIKQAIKYPYKGEMIRFFHRHLDLLVTPNHNMVVYSRGGSKKKPKGFYFEPAHKTAKRKWGNYKFFRGLHWEGEDIESIEFGGEKFSILSFVRFMGYYLSEGSTSINPEGRYVIKISQYNKDKKEIMIKHLKETPLKLWVGKNAIYLKAKNQKIFGEELLKLGKSYNKTVPEILLKLTPNLLKEFIYAYALGDGSVKKGKIWKGHKFKDNIVLFTSSKTMADKLGEIILKAGWQPSFNLVKIKGKKQKFKNGEYKINHNIWKITVKRSIFTSIGTNLKAEKVKYDDYVYCVELPKWHTLLVRRKGQIVWCGNCRCQTYAHFETVAVPYQVKRPPEAPQTPAQLELEKEYSSLTPEELYYKVKAHQGSSWYRMSNGNYDEEGKNLQRHFKKHKEKHPDIFKQYNIRTLNYYKKLSEEVIKNPDKIYIQRIPNGETDFLFVKDKFVVVSNDDGLFLKSLYILNKSIEKRIEEKLKDGFATIQIH